MNAKKITKDFLVSAAVAGLLGFGAVSCANTDADQTSQEQNSCSGKDGETNSCSGEKASCSGEKASCSAKGSCSGV